MFFKLLCESKEYQKCFLILFTFINILCMCPTGVEDHHMMAVPWETSVISELDLTSTELSTECLENILLRMPGFTYLALGYCEFFSDRVCAESSLHWS
jgi:hypothetical protein